MHWIRWARIAGIVLLIWILSTLDWHRVLPTLRSLDPLWLAAYFGCFAGTIAVRAIRLRICAARLGFPLSRESGYAAVVEPALMGAVTPGRVGEIARVGYLRQAGASFQAALALVTLERLMDVAILLCLGTGGMVYVFGAASIRGFGVPVAAVLLAVLYLAMLASPALADRMERFAAPVLRRLPFVPEGSPDALFLALRAVASRAATRMQALGVVCVLLNMGQILVLSLAFRFHADGVAICCAYSVATLVALLPVSIAGLGTREATYIYIMARQGIGREQALLFSLCDNVVLGMLALALMNLPLWVAGRGAGARGGRREA